MSEGNNLSGKYVHRTQRSLDNPEIPSKKDWWQEQCDKAGAKNYWTKAKKKKVVDKNKDND